MMYDAEQEIIDDNNKIKHIIRYMRYVDDETAEKLIYCRNIRKFYDKADEAYYDMIYDIIEYCLNTVSIKRRHIQFFIGQMMGGVHMNFNFQCGESKKYCMDQNKIFLDNQDDNSEYDYAEDKIMIEKKYVKYWKKQWGIICEE